MNQNVKVLLLFALFGYIVSAMNELSSYITFFILSSIFLLIEVALPK